MQASLALPRDDDRRDAQVVAALAQQAREDPTLFTPLYKRYRDPIYWYLRARVSRDEDAADLTQQVFLQALERLHQYQERKGSFAAWLFAIARHAATNSHRRPRLVAWDYLPPALQTTETDTTEADVLQRESVARITQLLESLPVPKRELLVLRFVSGLTIPDIAAILGKSPEATRKELRRTLDTLKERYDDPTI
jgi:RNA polymerase sigma-70 factor (ECF subfamily)